jgi:tRNA A58 N-methylase Trm61
MLLDIPLPVNLILNISQMLKSNSGTTLILLPATEDVFGLQSIIRKFEDEKALKLAGVIADTL